MGLHNYQRSFSPATLLLFTLLLVPIFAIYIPCEPGYGLVDPDKSQPDEKSCQPCQIKGCGMCTWDSSRCTRCPAYKGPAGSVTDDGSSKCRRCKSSKCGVCDNGYKRKCTGKIRGCPANIEKTKSAKKTSVKAILKSESPKCWENTQYWAGNGYTSLKVYQVDKKGRCLECQSEAWWRALADGGVNYCWYYQQSLGVLANAFQKKDGCPFPSSIKAKLKNQCLSDNRGQAFTIAQKFSAEYCGEKKTVYVTGEAKMIFSPGDGISAEVQYPYEDMKADGMVAWSYAS